MQNWTLLFNHNVSSTLNIYQCEWLKIVQTNQVSNCKQKNHLHRSKLLLKIRGSDPCMTWFGAYKSLTRSLRLYKFSNKKMPLPDQETVCVPLYLYSPHLCHLLFRCLFCWVNKWFLQLGRASFCNSSITFLSSFTYILRQLIVQMYSKALQEGYIWDSN